MQKAFVAFLQDPNRENYMALRQMVLSHPSYEPYSTELDDLVQLLQAEQFAEAQAKIKTMMPNWLLSPRVHFFASYVAKSLGSEEEHEAEKVISRICIDGLISTGDGTREKPYLVMRVSDEYDVMDFLDKQLSGQSLVEHEGRRFDHLTCADESEIWFDITDAMTRHEGGDA